MSEIHQMSLREIQVKIEKEIKSIQYQLKIQDFNSALQFANEIKNKYISPEEKSVLDKLKFDSLHNSIVAHKLDSEFAIIEEKLIKELKIPKIDKADGYLADMKALLNKIIANGTKIEKYQKRIDDFKAEVNKIQKLNPHLNPVPKVETDVEINQAAEFSDQIQAKQKPKKTPKSSPTNHTVIDRPVSSPKEELNQELNKPSPEPSHSTPTPPTPTTPPPSPPISPPPTPQMASPKPPTSPPPIKAPPPLTVPSNNISPPISPQNIVPPSTPKPQLPPQPAPPTRLITSPSPFQPPSSEINSTELISATEISSFQQDLYSNPPNISNIPEQATKIISTPTPPKHTIPSSIGILIENAGYTILSIKPKNPILQDLFNTFQIYYKCSETNRATHHHFLCVKNTFNNFSISASPEYIFSSREEKLPDMEKVQLKERKIQEDLYQPFSVVKRFIDDFSNCITDGTNNITKNNNSIIDAIKEIYGLIFPSNHLVIQKSPIFIRFKGKPLIINFSTMMIFSKSTKFHQKIPGMPSKYSIFYSHEDALPFYLDYFNSKFSILNTIREENINTLIIPQADRNYYDYMLKSGIILTFFSVLTGVSWLLNWSTLAIISFIIWLGIGGQIFLKRRNQFTSTYSKKQDCHFFSFLKFTPEQIGKICRLMVSQQKEIFQAEYSFTQTIKNKSPNMPLINTKPQKQVNLNPTPSAVVKTEALFGNLANFLD